MTEPRVSIIIPSYNYGRYLERAILGALGQLPRGDVQVIVADGGSADETRDILEKYSDHIESWSRPDKGFVDAVNQALAKARAPVVGILSADDYYLPGALAAALAALERHKRAAMVCGWEVLIDESGGIVHRTQPKGRIDPRSIIARQIPPQNACFVRKVWIERVGGLRLLNGSNFAADVDLWYRILHFATGIYLPRTLSVYQIHPSQMTSQGAAIYKSLEWMVQDCEAQPALAQRINLHPRERKSALARAEMFWLGRNSETRSQALERARHVLTARNEYDQSARVEAIKLLRSHGGIGSKMAVWHRVSAVLKARRDPLLEKIARSFAHHPPIDLDWWKGIALR